MMDTPQSFLQKSTPVYVDSESLTLKNNSSKYFQASDKNNVDKGRGSTEGTQIQTKTFK